MTEGRFPAVKIGVVAGVSCALTLTFLAAVFSVCAWGLRRIDEASREKVVAAMQSHEQTISPEFKAAMADYLAAVIAEHAAAAKSWKEFQIEQVITADKEKALTQASTTERESPLLQSAYSDQYGYDDCVKDATGPVQSWGRLYTLSVCESRYPLDRLRDVAKQTAAAN